MRPSKDQSLEGALDEGRRRLATDPAAAVQAARAALAGAPQHPEGRLLLAAALRRAGDAKGATPILRAMAATQPAAWGVQFELGAALAAMGEVSAAIPPLQRAAALNPQSLLVHATLSDQLRMLSGGDSRPASGSPPAASTDLLDLCAALLEDRVGAAEGLARVGLHLTDPTALKVLADLSLRLGRPGGAQQLAARGLTIAPGYAPLRFALALALYRQQRFAEAICEAERLVAQWPCRGFRSLRAALATETGDYALALRLSSELVAEGPDDSEAWLSHGHLLKIVGRQAESAAAYRRSLELAPLQGEAYWSLANLKVVPFTAADLSQMRALVGRDELPTHEKARLRFALGKALDDAGELEEAFRHYAAGARLRAAERPFDAEGHNAYVRRAIATFTPELFSGRTSAGAPAEDPIFVLGLPRSGSTLIEQILASHSQVEGLSELPELMQVAARAAAASPADYPAGLPDLSPSALRELGEAYLAAAAAHRRLPRPRFVDKFPGNFLHAGLIQLILPNARIVDVRRDALDCCVSCFTQDFAQGQAYSYDLTALGRYYRDYLALMDHFDRAMPGQVHRVEYEALLADPEAEVRRLLDYCGLAYEPGCLRFHETDRPVRTASSEQVRRPLSAAGLGRWRRFEPWLAPLKAALAGGTTAAA